MTLIQLPHYRQSLIARFDACPLSARFDLESELRTPGPQAALGTLLHRFAHQATRKMQVTGERMFPVDMGMELLRRVLCQSDVPSEDVVPITMEKMKWARVVATKWCENTEFDARKTLAVEERFFADLQVPPNDEIVKITGQLDLLIADPPDGVIVVDWKTGFRRPPTPRDQVKAEREGSGLTELGWAQWLIYSYLMFSNFPSIERVIFREVHVLWGEERQARMERWESERLTDVLASQVGLLQQAIREGADSPRWIPTAGPHCSMCRAPRRCPILEDEDLVVDTPEGRQRIAQEWVVAGETRTRRRAILDGLVEQYGPIPVLHSEGRRVVGWDYSPGGTRNFKMFEPKEIADSPYDEVLAEAAREAGVLAE